MDPSRSPHSAPIPARRITGRTANLILILVSLAAASQPLLGQPRLQQLVDRGVRSLHIEAPAAIDSQVVEQLQVKLPRDASRSARAVVLPEGWSMTSQDRWAVLSGPAGEQSGLLRFRLDVGAADLPDRLDIRVFSAGRRIFSRGLPVLALPPLETHATLDGMIAFPPLVSPGETIEFSLLDEALPRGGRWTVVGAGSQPVGPAGDRFRVQLPEQLTPGQDLAVRYDDAFGHTHVDVPSADSVQVVSRMEGPAWLNDCSRLSFAGSLICVCGYFPPEVREALLIGERPLGQPVTSSEQVLYFRLPPDIRPAQYVIRFDPAVGTPSGEAEITVVRVVGSIDEDELWRGQRTSMRLAIVGTTETLTLDVSNLTPAVIGLEGGEQQSIPIPGSGEVGRDGQMPDLIFAERGVNARRRGDFSINYTLQGSDCPCLEEPLTFTHVLIRHPKGPGPIHTCHGESIPLETIGISAQGEAVVSTEYALSSPLLGTIGEGTFVPGEVEQDLEGTITTTLGDLTTSLDVLVTTECPGQDCLPVRTEMESGPPPRVRVDPALPVSDYLYPRPIPLQAVARDHDLIHFYCSGCGEGESKLTRPVEDRIGRYSWELEGKGSLNAPFLDTENLDQLLASIEEVREQIRKVTQEIEEKKKEKEQADQTRQSRREELEAAKGLLDEKLTAVESTIGEIEGRIKELDDQIAKQDQAIESARAAIADLESRIQQKQGEIEELEKKIAGEPSPEEQQLAQQLADLQNQIESRKQEFEQLRAQNAAQEEALRAAVDQAESQLQNARGQLNQLNQAVQAKQDEIASLEGSLFANPMMRDFFSRRTQASRLSQQLRQHYLPSSGLPPAPAQELNTLSRRFVTEPSRQAREDVLRQFTSQKNSLLDTLSNGCQGLPGGDAAACGQGVEELRNELDQLEQLQNGMLDNPLSQLQLQRLADLTRLQAELAQLSAATARAAQTVEAAEAAVAAALNAYNSGLSQFDEAERELQAQISELEAEATRVEAEFNAAKSRRETEWENNVSSWIEQVARLRSEIEELQKQIALEETKIEAAQNERARLEKDRREAQNRKNEAEGRRELLQFQKQRVEEKLAALDREAADFDQQIRRLEEEKQRLEEQLRELERRRAAATQGVKSGTGQLVYFIPPPLELILKDPDRFQQLKEDVAAAETDLEEARGDKAALQKHAFEILKTTTQQLWKLREALDLIEELGKKIGQLDIDQGKLKNQIALENQEKLARAQAEKDRLEQEKTRAEQHLKESQRAEAEAKRAVEEARASLQEAQQELAQARADMELKQGGYRFDRQQRLLKGAALEAKKAQHENTIAEMRRLETRLANAENQLSQAAGAEEETRATGLRRQITELEGELETVRQRVATERAEIQEMTTDFRLKTEAEKSSRAAADEAERAFQAAQRKLDLAHQKLRQANTNLDKQTEQRLADERAVNRLEDDIQAQAEKIQLYNRLINMGIDADERVMAKQQELDSAREELEKAQGPRNAAINALNQQIAARDEWRENKKQANTRIADARRQLENAQKVLRDFLVGEFQGVDFSVTLKLEVEDTPLDGWRSSDGPRTLEFQIQYPGSRTPRIDVASVDLSPPGEEMEPGPCIPKVEFNLPTDLAKTAPAQKGVEPQTIALFYKQGQPLYPEWPPAVVSPPNLEFATTGWVAGGSDTDGIVYRCVPAAAALAVGLPLDTVAETCRPGPGKADRIADPAHFTWSGDGTVVTSAGEAEVFVKLPPVPRDQCRSEGNLTVLYSDSGLQAADLARDENKFPNQPAVVVEVAEEIHEFGPDDKTVLTIRLVEGDHTGLGGETILWEVAGALPAELDPTKSTKYGFEAAKSKTATRTTDGEGYSKIDFFLEDRYGEVTVKVRWQRGGGDCKAREIKVRRLLEFSQLSIGFAPRQGWEQAEQIFTGGTAGAQALEARAKALPEASETSVVLATGLRDDQQDPIDERKVQFQVLDPKSASMEPEQVDTKIHGLAWSFVKDAPEDAKLQLQAEVQEEIRDFTEPPKLEATQPTRTIKRFRIGPEGRSLLLEAEGEFVPGGAPYRGGCKLIIEPGVKQLPAEFATLTLNADGIETPAVEGDDPPLAQAGTVDWSGALEFSQFGFQLRLTSLGVTAGADARIEGEVTLPKTSEKPAFQAILGPGGFLGDVRQFPEIQLARMKLERGAAVVIDFHRQQDPEAPPQGWAGFGLLLRQARVVLPEAFQGKADAPPAVSVKDLFVNASGLSGKVALEHTVSAALGKLDFTLEKIGLTFAENKPTGGSLDGKVTFPDPFVGDLNIGLEILSGGEDFAGRVSTDHPISAPRLGLVFSLLPDTSLSYQGGVFEFSLSAVLSSEKFSDITIQGFRVDSNGDIEAEAISINKDISLGRGFQVYLNTFGFKKTADEYGLSLDCKFQFAEILEAEKVAVKISSGPRIDEFDMTVRAQRKPVSFESSIHYDEDRLEGSVEVDVEKLFKINGMFVLGVQEMSPEEKFRYWYVELSSRTAIPLGNTGLNIIELGGGVGYNYDPPVGSAGGAPRHTQAFSFKALIGVGNAPRGEVFAGRVTLVLVTGKFSINGKVWLLKREESLYGEGQLDIYWEPSSKLAGFVRMVTALPDSGGSILRFNGQVDFLFAGPSEWYIKSRTLEGAILQRVKAEGNVQVHPGRAHLDGRVYYDLYKEVGVAIVTLKVDVHLEAGGSLDFIVTETTATLQAQAYFNGSWDVNLDTPIKEFDIIAGDLTALLSLRAGSTEIVVAGSVTVSWDTWVHSGSVGVDIGYSV